MASPDTSASTSSRSSMDQRQSSSLDGSRHGSLQDLTLSKVWEDEVLVHALRTFASSEYAEENVAFVQDVLLLKKTGDKARIQEIYAEYIRVGSAMEINVTGRTKAMISFKIESGEIIGLDIFDEAVHEVTVLTETSIFGKFKEDLAARAALLPPPAPTGIKRVVIVGGGFTGAACAHILDKMPRFQVVMIDWKEYFEYTGGMLHALVDPPKAARYHVSYKKVLPNGRFIIGQCQQVNKDHVIANNERIPYDYLVVSTGSSYSSKLKDRYVSTCYRAKRVMVEFQALENAKSILIIGGGLLGVEMSSEIASRFPLKQVTLVDSNPYVLKRLPPKSRELAKQWLERIGVRVVLNQRVTSFDLHNRIFITSQGEQFACDKVYIATGPQPNTAFLRDDHMDWLDERGTIKVTSGLQVVGESNIFSGGDVCNLRGEKVVYIALQHGITIARNICRVEKGKPALCMGEKGTAKAGWPPLVISLGDKSGMFVAHGKSVKMGKSWLTYKANFVAHVLRMLTGEDKFDRDMGRLPSQLTRGAVGPGERMPSVTDAKQQQPLAMR